MSRAAAYLLDTYCVRLIASWPPRLNWIGWGCTRDLHGRPLQGAACERAGCAAVVHHQLRPRWFGAQGFDTLSSALRTGELEAVPAALMLHVNPGGPSEAGLRRRRKAEAKKTAPPKSACFGGPLQHSWI